MIVVYDSEGRISYTVEPPYPAGLETAYTTLATADPEFNYVANSTIETIVDKYIDTSVTPELTERPSLSLTYNTEVSAVQPLVIDGLPEGTLVYIDGDINNSYTPASGEDQVEIGASDPGVYTVTVDPPFPYKLAEFEITVS